ncbi:PIN domain-containing protein [Natronoarchaeum mannanilyticum]|uniref:PIN domain-containing protein n=1 Tax=Natronoarchaeum mannanilyticum TaxID=926360 RepID=A0AAV3TBD6_9EURY
MTAAYVFDTEAIIAFLYAEPGHEAVERRLAEVFREDAAGRESSEPSVAGAPEDAGEQSSPSPRSTSSREDAEGLLAASNASEVFYLVARFEGDSNEPTTASLRTADRDVRALERRGLSVQRADWRLVGEIKAHGDISLADACAVALAHDRDATLLAGADDDFDDLPVDVSVERFRTDGV